MKRRREMEKKITEIRSAIEELTLIIVKLKPVVEVKAIDDHRGNDDNEDDDVNRDASSVHIPIRPFLSLCNLILQILDKIGPTMAVLRQDVHQNIQRLEAVHESEPSKCWSIADIIKKEVHEGIQRKGNSCCKALVWLTRSLDFTAALLQRLAIKDDSGVEKSMEQAVEESYGIALKPWHGWIASAAFRVALKLVPDKSTFISLLSAKGESDEDIKEEIKTVVSLFEQFLEEVHSTLKFYNLENLKST